MVKPARAEFAAWKARQAVPTHAMRCAGMIAASIVLTATSAALVTLLDAVGTPEKTISLISRILIFSGPGIAMLGWRWPETAIFPFRQKIPVVRAVPGRLGKLLHSPIQRALFVLGGFGLLPWFFMHPLRQLRYNDGVTDYLYRAFVDPFMPWFEFGSFYMFGWYDWLALPCLVSFLLAFSWPHTGARLINWIRNA